MAKNNPDLCPICGQFIDIIVSSFAEVPFITGKCYPEICFTCSAVPKVIDENGKFNVSPKRLHSVEEMVELGYDKIKSKNCIKAVKRLTNNVKDYAKSPIYYGI